MDSCILKIIGTCDLNEKDLVGIHNFKHALLGQEDAKYFGDHYSSEANSSIFASVRKNSRFRYYKKEVALKANIDNICFEFDVVDVLCSPSRVNVFSIGVKIDLKLIDIGLLPDFFKKIANINSNLMSEGKSLTIGDQILICFFNNNEKKSDRDCFFANSSSVLNIYFVGQLKKDNNINRSELLYDLATRSQLGSAAGHGYLAPHPDFLRSFEDRYLRIYKNYECLSILNGFCVVGNDLLDAPWKIGVWSFNYFRLYFYAFYLKCEMRRFMSSEMDMVRYFDFEEFYCKQYINSVSFSFLPQMIYSNMKAGLELDKDADEFKSRMQMIYNAEMEDIQKKNGLVIKGASFVLTFVMIPMNDLYDLFGKIGLDRAKSFLFIYSAIFLVPILIALYIYKNRVRTAFKNVMSFVRKKT